MIQTVVTPETEDITIHVPHSYVGKELKITVSTVTKKGKKQPVKKTFGNSGLMGSLHLTEERYQELQQYAKDVRNEWERDI